MLNLLKNIFSQSQDVGSNLPPALVDMAIERAVDGTDPRVRIMSGYLKALRKPVTHAIQHVIDLVECLPAPVAVDRTALFQDQAFAALFYSEERMAQIIARDAALREFRAANRGATAPITTLLAAHRKEKRGFGNALVGDRVLSEVPRTTVSFEQHRLLDPAFDEQEARRLLKRRAFDHLLLVALARVTKREGERKDLSSRRVLLRSKFEVLRRGGGFAGQTSAAELGKLQTCLEDIEKKLSALGSREETLPDNLDIVAKVLADAEHHLWQEDKVLCLDRLYVLHDKPGPAAPATRFKELHNSEGLQATIMMISIGHDYGL